MEGLLVYTQNVNGLRTKTAEFKLTSFSGGADLYLITESNLCKNISDSEVFDLSQYSVFRRDRENTCCSLDKKSGGGVMIGVRNKIRSVHQEQFQSEAEDLWITLQITDHCKIHTNTMSWYLVLFSIFLTIQQVLTMDCSRSECLKLADPLVREPRFIFPDNREDIQRGCRTWDEFVNCLKHYTEECFNEEDRRRFNNAVESPIENIHELCMNVKYQNEYLKFAPCIKSTITERNHCGLQYQMLVDQVYQRDNSLPKSTLCCLHDKFKQCVQRETRRLCDRDGQNGQATRFSMQILDKALRFIEDQCVNYIPNSGDCNSFQDSLPSTDILSISTVSSEVYPWSTIQETNFIKEARNPPNRGTTSNISPPYSWQPSPSTPSEEMVPPSSPTSMTDVLGSRTRPASYGRASSWSDIQGPSASVPVTQNSYPIYSEKVSTTESPKPYWMATTSSWNVMKKDIPNLGSANNNREQARNPTPKESSASYHTTTTVETTHWYPAAGSHLSNEIEEPNQQGLTVQKDQASLLASSIHTLFLAILFKLLV